jgi:hypothetical protein
VEINVKGILWGSQYREGINRMRSMGSLLDGGDQIGAIKL